jgi:hypothetical protein
MIPGEFIQKSRTWCISRRITSSRRVPAAGLAIPGSAALSASSCEKTIEIGIATMAARQAPRGALFRHPQRRHGAAR